jgi:hypothetical protein
VSRHLSDAFLAAWLALLVVPIAWGVAIVPRWLIIAWGVPTLIWWAWDTTRERRRAHRLATGRCLACGYDLRGTPERKTCPECGAEQETRPV